MILGFLSILFNSIKIDNISGAKDDIRHIKLF